MSQRTPTLMLQHVRLQRSFIRTKLSTKTTQMQRSAAMHVRNMSIHCFRGSCKNQLATTYCCSYDLQCFKSQNYLTESFFAKFTFEPIFLNGCHPLLAC